mmetsp:Transcript_6421/g.13347  ORF Transcript_6421/g.13347 Transcript_6421/m.13347 type:complete len:244 (+) Transcript_6421:151-882(+)
MVTTTPSERSAPISKAPSLRETRFGGSARSLAPTGPMLVLMTPSSAQRRAGTRASSTWALSRTSPASTSPCARSSRLTTFRRSTTRSRSAAAPVVPAGLPRAILRCAVLPPASAVFSLTMDGALLTALLPLVLPLTLPTTAATRRVIRGLAAVLPSLPAASPMTSAYSPTAQQTAALIPTAMEHPVIATCAIATKAFPAVTSGSADGGSAGDTMSTADGPQLRFGPLCAGVATRPRPAGTLVE